MDVLRGCALLGILLLNIQSFAMPSAAYLNPTAYGDLSGINFWVWSLSHVFADQKFMSIFSMLFGAGIILFANSAEKKTGSSAALHYRRTAWLLMFGLIHGYLFWYGDILYAYAMCGFFVYLLRNKSIITLVIIAAVLFSIASIYSLLMGSSLPHFPPEAMAGLKEAWSPDSVALEKELNAYRSGFIDALYFRAEETLFMQTYVFLTIFIWRASAMMLLGMALFKSGFFQLEWSNKRYTITAVIGLIVGYTLSITGIINNTEQQFSLEYSMFIGSQYNYWGSVFSALAYASLIMLLCKSSWLNRLKTRFAAIGKTAFSNYILHTLICTTIFYGFGYFGELLRWQQLLLVAIIWVLQMLVSTSYLKRFQFGPLEWLWRSLTYWRLQPLKKASD